MRVVRCPLERTSPTPTVLDFTGEAGFTYTAGTDTLASVNYTSTGTIDAQGVLDAPSGIGITVDAAGEMGVDTSGTYGQFLYHEGGGLMTVEPTDTVCVTLENLTGDDDNVFFWSPPHATTVVEAWCLYSGTATTAADIDLQDGAGNAMTMTDADCADGDAGVATVQSVTAANALALGEALAFNVTNTPDPTTLTTMICVRYTVDRR